MIVSWLRCGSKVAEWQQIPENAKKHIAFIPLCGSIYAQLRWRRHPNAVEPAPKYGRGNTEMRESLHRNTVEATPKCGSLYAPMR